MRSVCPVHLILFDLYYCNNICQRAQMMKLLICIFHLPPVPSCPLGSNVPLSTLLPNTLNLCSSLRWETKFHTHVHSTDVTL